MPIKMQTMKFMLKKITEKITKFTTKKRNEISTKRVKTMKWIAMYDSLDFRFG